MDQTQVIKDVKVEIKDICRTREVRVEIGKQSVRAEMKRVDLCQTESTAQQY